MIFYRFFGIIKDIKRRNNASFFIPKFKKRIINERKSLSWRNNNPGNLRFSPFSIRHGATHESEGFAFFPNYEIGFSALCSLLKTKIYREMTLFDAMHRYAPTSENHTENYIEFIEKQTGFSRDEFFKNLDTEKIANAIQKFEGWKPQN